MAEISGSEAEGLGIEDECSLLVSSGESGGHVDIEASSLVKSIV